MGKNYEREKKKGQRGEERKTGGKQHGEKLRQNLILLWYLGKNITRYGKKGGGLPCIQFKIIEGGDQGACYYNLINYPK